MAVVSLPAVTLEVVQAVRALIRKRLLGGNREKVMGTGKGVGDLPWWNLLVLVQRFQKTREKVPVVQLGFSVCLFL
jgi:hypothetical protein